MSALDSHYATLGADAGMSEQELTALWRGIARRLHPDRHALKTPAEQRAASEAFATASVAYGVLSDRRQRAEYDRQLRIHGAECPECGGAGRTWSGPLARRVASRCEACAGCGRIERRRA